MEIIDFTCQCSTNLYYLAVYIRNICYYVYIYIFFIVFKLHNVNNNRIYILFNL